MYRVFAILFLIAPFVAGLFRAFSTGTDLRLMWMALASYVGAAAVMAVMTSRGAPTKSVLALFSVVLVVATLAAGLVGFLLGATAGPGVWMVAFVLGVFLAAGCALFVLSRSARSA